MRNLCFFCLTLSVLCTAPAHADYIVARHTIRAQAIIEEQDLILKKAEQTGITTPQDLIGKEAQVTIYAGGPVRLSDVGTPAVVERNQIIPLVFRQNGLLIHTEGRSLTRASPGDYVRVMNLSSRTTVSGWVSSDGRVFVSNMEDANAQ